MTKEEIQKEFQEYSNELVGDMMALMNKYYVKRLKAEQQMQEVLKVEETNKTTE